MSSFQRLKHGKRDCGEKRGHSVFIRLVDINAERRGHHLHWLFKQQGLHGEFTMITGHRHGIHEGYHLTHLARMEDGHDFKTLHNLSKDQAQSSRQ